MLFTFRFNPVSNEETVLRNYASRDFVCPQYFSIVNGEVKDWDGITIGHTITPNLSFEKGQISENTTGWGFYVHLAQTKETSHYRDIE